MKVAEEKERGGESLRLSGSAAPVFYIVRKIGSKWVKTTQIVFLNLNTKRLNNTASNHVVNWHFPQKQSQTSLHTSAQNLFESSRTH